MSYALLFNIAVNTILGVAFLMAWQRDRVQSFTRDFGLGYLALVAMTVLYGLLRHVLYTSPLRPVLLAAAVGMLFTYLILMLCGSARLAGLEPSFRRHAPVALSLSGLGLIFFLGQPIEVSMAASASAHVLAGALACWWLWSRGPVERFIGILLLIVGAAQFIVPVCGMDYFDLQVALASLLRMTLGLALLQVALIRSAEAAQRLQGRFVQLIEHSQQGVVIFQDAEVKYANPALQRLYGLQHMSELHGRWPELMTAEDREDAIARLRRLRLGESEVESWEGRRTRLDGKPLFLRFTAWRTEWEGLPAVQEVISDETERHDAMQALLHQATHDELTGLPNRSAMFTRLRELCTTPPEGGFSLTLVDIDRFNLFNQAHGAAVGDEVLKALAAVMKGALHPGTELLHLGEDEFALIVPGRTDEGVRCVADHMRALLAQPLELPGHRFFIDVSMGAACYPDTGTEPEALVRAANAAMQVAKQLPGTTMQLAEPRFAAGSGASLQAEQALRAGLQGAEFSLVYQPKVDAASGALMGFEALVRWDRPGHGRISPLDFIPAAERTGLIIPLGALILDIACRQIAEWRTRFDDVVPVAVNVSPLQLLDAGFPDIVSQTLERHRVPPHLLTIEITESAAVTSMAQAVEQIGLLRTQGIVFALDDFGTGFSSLSMLRSLPLQTVKIDRSLIDPLPSPDAFAVVAAICSVASALRLDVVAEGVETEEHARAAREAGCTALQGYLYAKPLEVDKAGEWLERR
ncbi:MAG: EAL domain-containing protein [Aquabacterium sp.]|nr:MAG: EAL domain-containing protein [Aquabacterium sp.]